LGSECGAASIKAQRVGVGSLGRLADSEKDDLAAAKVRENRAGNEEKQRTESGDCGGLAS